MPENGLYELSHSRVTTECDTYDWISYDVGDPSLVLEFVVLACILAIAFYDYQQHSYMSGHGTPTNGNERDAKSLLSSVAQIKFGDKQDDNHLILYILLMGIGITFAAVIFFNRRAARRRRDRSTDVL